MLFFKRNIKSLLLEALMTVAAVVAFTSCGVVHDDLDPCPQGVKLRFIYDYNMEFANAFHSQVDCLTVLVYDEHGSFIMQRTVTNPDELADENWRMTLDLPEGSYKVVAYGGMACSDSSFEFVNPVAEGSSLQQLGAVLKSSKLTAPQGTELHSLFYGAVDVEVAQSSTDYASYTLPMIKDTNNLRIMLQQLSGEPVNNDDFVFEIVDDNTLMGWDNAVIPSATTVYSPWTQGQAIAGIMAKAGEVKVAYAEFSVPRLVTSNTPRLRITLRADGSEVINIPLINYLSLLKSEHYSTMSAQEYLDRESRWTMMFFLDSSNKWVNTQIVINDWIVRINDVDF